MNTRSRKRISLFFSSLFIFFLHLPFVFAKSKSNDYDDKHLAVSANSPKKISAINSGMDKNSVAIVYDRLNLASAGLSLQVFEYAIGGFEFLKTQGKFGNTNILTIADFSQSSRKKRLFVIDLENYKVLFNTYVAHGMNSGQEFAKYFSNTPESNKSSLGFYKTGVTYNGKHGYSLHLLGVEKGINDNAYNRDIVMHAADYVSESMINAKGFLGRSHGCPAVPEKLHKPIINKIKDGTCLFIFGEDRNYLRRSAVIHNAMPLLALK